MLDAEQAVRYAVDPARYLNPNRVGTLIDSADVDTAVALGPDLPANAPAVLPAGDSGGRRCTGWRRVAGAGAGRGSAGSREVALTRLNQGVLSQGRNGLPSTSGFKPVRRATSGGSAFATRRN